MTMTPEFYTAEGRIPADMFTVFAEPGRTLYIHGGVAPVVLTRVMLGTTEVTNLANRPLLPGAAVSFPHAAPASAAPGKVRGTGLLMRNGQVVRDNPTPETLETDAAHVAAYLRATMEQVRALVAAGIPDDAIHAHLKTRSYGSEDARNTVINNARNSDPAL